jgi:predicted ATPase
MTALGRAEEGRNSLLEGLSIVRAAGQITSLSWLLILLAEANTKLNRPLEGLSYIAEAARLIENGDERIAEAELYRVRGDLLKATGDQEPAEASYHRALAVARRQQAKTLELRAVTSLARLWRDQDKRIEACNLLAPVYGWFTEGFDTPVLQDAKALLDHLG